MDFHPPQAINCTFLEDLQICFKMAKQTDPIIHFSARVVHFVMERFPPEVQDLVRQLKSAGMAIDENNPQDILKAWKNFLKVFFFFGLIIYEILWQEYCLESLGNGEGGEEGTFFSAFLVRVRIGEECDIGDMGVSKNRGKTPKMDGL